MPFIELTGISSYYEQHGEGEPIVLLHGGFCSIETWQPQIEALAGRYRLHAPERPGHGRTPDRPGPITYQGMVDDTIAYLDVMDVDSAHIVGFSDGAITGLLLALQHPARIRSLVAISANLDPSIFGNEDDAGEELTEELAEAAEPDEEELAYARLSPDGADHAAVILEKLITMWKSEPHIDPADLATVQLPTLILAGDQDSIPTTHTVGIAQAIPGAQLCIVPAAGHLVIRERADRVNQAIVEFLASLP